MSDIEFDPEAVADARRRLLDPGPALREAATVSSPDAGCSTATTATTLLHLGARAAALADRLDALATEADASSVTYEDADGLVGSELGRQVLPWSG